MRSKKTSKDSIENLYKSISDIRDKKEAQIFFEKYLTEREINDISRRIELLGMLERGLTYREIQENLKMSPITISKLSIRMGYGALEEKRSKPTKTEGRKISYKGAKTNISKT